LYFETCYETATGLGGGQFLQLLNGPSNPLPVLQTSVAPTYYFIAGDTSPNGSTPAGTDGLITAVGTALCGPDPQVCINATAQTALVQGPQGLCHAAGLITCSSSNAPEVSINDKTHPMWSNICTFLDSVDAASPTNQNQLCNGAYTIGGQVAGLTGTGLVLLNNGGDSLSINSNGSFTFQTALPTGAGYNVTVGTQPSGETCFVSYGVGAVGTGNTSSTIVNCAGPLPPGASIANLLSASCNTNNGTSTLQMSFSVSGPVGTNFGLDSAPSYSCGQWSVLFPQGALCIRNAGDPPSTVVFFTESFTAIPGVSLPSGLYGFGGGYPNVCYPVDFPPAVFSPQQIICNDEVNILCN